MVVAFFFFFMRLELCIYYTIKGKENLQEKKKKKVVVKTDIVARMTHVAKEKLGCRGTRHQGAWVSQEGIRAGSSDCS